MSIHNVFEHFVQEVAHVQLAVRVGRTIMQYKVFAISLRALPGVQSIAANRLQFRFARLRLRVQRERGRWQQNRRRILLVVAAARLDVTSRRVRGKTASESAF